jgi:predicted TIM-barrel fold metal-dependent hydrolase
MADQNSMLRATWSDLPLRRYRPTSQLRHAEHLIAAPACPAIDAHNHLGRWLSVSGDWIVADVAELIDRLDEAGVTAVVNLDGRWGAELDANLDRYDRAHPGRFATFCHLDWTQCQVPAWPGRLAKQLDGAARAGAAGLKVWKDLGLRVRDEHGHLVLPGDPRLTPVWEAASAHGLPVLIHTGDPAAFFEPLDETNERLEELLAHPDWSFADERFPRLRTLLDSLEQLVTAQPAVTFIAAHLGFPEDLGWVDRMLTSHPNFFVDTGARLAELGRQPRRTRALLTRHPDRVLFGTDAFPPDVAEYRRWFRFLETADEGFPYSGNEPPPQGRWSISGADLPAELLRKVYGGNARRIIPALRR